MNFFSTRCAIEDSVTYYPLNDTFFGFRFRSFWFQGALDQLDGDLVYIHCKGIVCPEEEKSETCDRSCGVTVGRRKKRNADVAGDFWGNFMRHPLNGRFRRDAIETGEMYGDKMLYLANADGPMRMIFREDVINSPPNGDVVITPANPAQDRKDGSIDTNIQDDGPLSDNLQDAIKLGQF